MLNFNHLQITAQRQREMEQQAKNWRLTHQKDEYKPNPTIRRKRRK